MGGVFGVLLLRWAAAPQAVPVRGLTSALWTTGLLGTRLRVHDVCMGILLRPLCIRFSLLFFMPADRHDRSVVPEALSGHARVGTVGGCRLPRPQQQTHTTKREIQAKQHPPQRELRFPA